MELELQGAASDDEKEAIKQRYAEMANNVEMEFELDELAFQEQIKAEMDKDKQKEKEIILRAFVTDAARNKSEYFIEFVARWRHQTFKNSINTIFIRWSGSYCIIGSNAHERC